MLKFNFKLLTSIIICLLLLSSLSYAANEISYNINNDLCLSLEDNYELSSTLEGNAFIAVDSFILDSNNTSSVINGNLFVAATEVKITSGSRVSGNTFIITKKFTLETGSEIAGDLYIIADEINVNSKSTIGGNIFAISSTFNLNGIVSNSVYANCNQFNMFYDGIINKTLNLSATDANINGLISKDSNISADTITTKNDFINYGNIDFRANDITFSGQIGQITSNSTISLKAPNLNFSNLAETNIIGNLIYSSNKEINDLSNIVNGEISYSKYLPEHTSNKSIFNTFIGLISLLAFVCALYVINTKVIKIKPSKLFTFKQFLISFGIGFILLIAVPLLFVILCFIKIGITLAFVLLTSYILIMLLSMPIFIFSIAKLLKTKLKYKISEFTYIFIITFFIWLLKLIPSINIILTILLLLTGSGLLFLNICSSSMHKH